MRLTTFMVLYWPTLLLGLSPPTSQPAVTISNGTLLGIRNDHYNQDFFLNIPFAQPPIGDLRFERAQPLNQTWGTRNATTFGPRCHSAPLYLPIFFQSGFPAEESEDCLTINIVRPAVENLAALPVLVWIYGGGFQEGGADDQRYNMSFLVQESVRVGSPIIGVTFNHRISGFGFLGGSAVYMSGVANIGLYDQRLALHWIQENIAAFNGDPSKVTIQGESAGAYSVADHFLAFGGRDDGLFRAGISESGGFTQLPSMDQQDALYSDVLNKTNCINTSDTLKCLREADVLDLKRAFQDVNYFPVIDGGIIQQQPYTSLREGRFVKRPMLLGSNTNEGTSFVILQNLRPNNSADFKAIIAARIPGVTNQETTDLANEYLDGLTAQETKSDLGSVLPSPGPQYGPLFGKTAFLFSDLLFIGAQRCMSEAWHKFGVPAYSYRFDVTPNGFDPTINGAGHFSEVPFVFRNFNGVGHEVNFLGANSTEDRVNRLQLSNQMSHRWLSFATELTPNARWVGKGLEKSIAETALAQRRFPGFNLKWPVYRHKSRVNLVFSLRGLYLEEDSWRSSAIRRLNEVLDRTSGL